MKQLFILLILVITSTAVHSQGQNDSNFVIDPSGQKHSVKEILKDTFDERDRQSEELKTQTKILYLTYSVIVLFAVVIFLVTISYRQNKKKSKELEIRNKKIEYQKNLIELHRTEIVDSITYAKRLQEAILPPLDEVNENISNNFILYKPKSIVSGDFYWAEKLDNYYFIAAADCTGHGVPGAIVSMVCSNALNRSVIELKITDTNKILDNVRILVLDAFKKSGEEINDGMDISLCRINKVNNEIQWSGANNPLWYFVDNELIEIKADKQPIGSYHDPKPFIAHIMKLPINTNLYLFTDGYADQFSEDNKKMTKRRFKDILKIAHTKSMKEQELILNDYFLDWKGDTEQVDDVCVIGIQV
jgi:serine phosphatase RsbU (regulator of sigma subunit)